MAAGLSWTLVVSRDTTKSFGIEALAGPDLRLQSVTIRVGESHSGQLDVRPRVRVAGGAFATVGSLRFTLRVDGVIPEDGGLIAGVAIQL